MQDAQTRRVWNWKKSDEIEIPSVHKLHNLELSFANFKFKMVGEGRLKVTTLQIRGLKDINESINPSTIQNLEITNEIHTEDFKIVNSFGKKMYHVKKLKLTHHLEIVNL